MDREQTFRNIVDVAFQLTGESVPLDHGYRLYSALCTALPALHGAAWLSVHPLAGTPTQEATLMLRDQARLFLRLPAERIPDVLPLAGRTIEVAGIKLALGAPSVSALVPASCLDARLVVLKLTDVPHRENPGLGRQSLDVVAFSERYASELKRQLNALDIQSPPELCGRQRLTVSGKRVVGYSVRVGALSADQSLALQANGLGGKRRMGCGIFRATRGT